MLSLEEKAEFQWMKESMKLLLANAGIKSDTSIIDAAKAEQEAIAHREHCQCCVDEARQAVGDKYAVQLKQLADEAEECRKCEDVEGYNQKLTERKNLLEVIAVEAQAEEDRVRAEMNVPIL